MTTTIRAEFTSHTVTYHLVEDAEVTELVAAVKAEEHISVEVTVDVLSLEEA